MNVDDKTERWLTPGVVGIGTASLLSDLGHEIPTALLPSLLTSTLGAPAAALGLIEGVSDGLAGLARFAGGALAEDPDRRRTVAVSGYAATAVLAAGTGMTTAVWQVGLLRAGAWAARGLRVPARNALLADVVDPRAYGRAYGFERAMDNLGAIGGPLLAIGLVAALGTRWAIAVSVLPGLAAAIAIIYAIRRTPAPTVRERTPIRLRVRPVLTGGLGRLFAGISAFEIGNCAATLYILRATDLLEPGHGRDSATTIALALYVTYNAAATLTSLAAGRLSDQRTPRFALILGVAAFALAYAGFTRDTSAWVSLLPWFVAAGVGIGFVETAEHAAVASAAPIDLRGSAFGLLAGVQSFGNLAASGIAGVLWSVFSPSWAFTYLTGWMILALVLLITVPVPQHPATHNLNHARNHTKPTSGRRSTGSDTARRPTAAGGTRRLSRRARRPFWRPRTWRSPSIPIALTRSSTRRVDTPSTPPRDSTPVFALGSSAYITN